ncbi:MAG: hypothetical protein GY711_33010 [bacterium]|nr:hypothetical protein [bacterium]
MWSFSCRRSLRIAAPLKDGATWDRDGLRVRGLREAGLTAAWTLLVVSSLN